MIFIMMKPVSYHDFLNALLYVFVDGMSRAYFVNKRKFREKRLILMRLNTFRYTENSCSCGKGVHFYMGVLPAKSEGTFSNEISEKKKIKKEDLQMKKEYRLTLKIACEVNEGEDDLFSSLTY